MEYLSVLRSDISLEVTEVYDGRVIVKIHVDIASVTDDISILLSIRNSLYVLHVLIFSRPQNLPLPYCFDMRVCN